MISSPVKRLKPFGRSEHTALMVGNPHETSVWCATHLGFRVIRVQENAVFIRHEGDAPGGHSTELYTYDPGRDKNVNTTAHLAIRFGTPEELISAAEYYVQNGALWHHDFVKNVCPGTDGAANPDNGKDPQESSGVKFILVIAPGNLLLQLIWRLDPLTR